MTILENLPGALYVVDLQSYRLLFANRASIAQTLVHQGVDLTRVITRSSLAAGLRVALEKTGLRLLDAA